MSQTTMELQGVKEVLAKLEEQLGEAKARRIESKALTKAADKAVIQLKSALGGAYSNTGETVSGVTHGNVSRVTGQAEIKIGNNGKHWRLVHLNEMGYTRHGKTYHTNGFGVIQRFVEEQKSQFKTEVAEGLKELIR